MMAKAQRNYEEEQYAKDVTRHEQQAEVITAPAQMLKLSVKRAKRTASMIKLTDKHWKIECMNA